MKSAQSNANSRLSIIRDGTADYSLYAITTDNTKVFYCGIRRTRSELRYYSCFFAPLNKLL